MNPSTPLHIPVTTTSSSTRITSSSQPQTNSDEPVPVSTWSILSYTSNTKLQTLRAVVDRLGIVVPPGKVTKESLANLLIANHVRYPNPNEDIVEWSLKVQSLIPNNSMTNNPNSDELNMSSSNKRTAADALVARNLHNKLNAILDSDTDSSSDYKEHSNDQIVNNAGSSTFNAKPNKRAKHADSQLGPELTQMNNQLAGQGQQMQQMMQMFGVLQNNIKDMNNKICDNSSKWDDYNLQSTSNNRLSADSNINPVSINHAQPLVHSCSNISCDYRSTDLQEKFCKLHGALMIAEQLKLVPLSQSALQTTNATNARGVINSTGLHASNTWNQYENNLIPNNNHVTDNSQLSTSCRPTAIQGNSITTNNNYTIEPTFPFAQIHSFIPEKIIQEARKGKWIPLAKFLPSATAMKNYETEQGLESNAVPFYKLAQALEAVKNNTTTQSISSPFQLLQAFGGGLIPAACEGNPNRLVDYQLFLLEIITLMQQQQWQFVLSYVEEVRRSKQATESNWANHKLAANNESGLHQETWLKQLARFQQQNGKQFSTGNSNNHSYNNSSTNSNNYSSNSASNVNNNGSATEATYSNNYISHDGTAAINQEVCRFFADNGRCRFGNSCRHLHENKKRKNNSSTSAPTNTIITPKPNTVTIPTIKPEQK